MNLFFSITVFVASFFIVAFGLHKKENTKSPLGLLTPNLRPDSGHIHFQLNYIRLELFSKHCCHRDYCSYIKMREHAEFAKLSITAPTGGWKKHKNWSNRRLHSVLVMLGGQ